jgi:hypothetical protein
VNDPAQSIRIAPRWPVAITALAVLFLLTVLPWRIRVFPIWVPYIGVIGLIVPMAAIKLTTAKPRRLLIERTTTLLFCVIAEGATSLLWRVCWARWCGERERSAAISFLLQALRRG